MSGISNRPKDVEDQNQDRVEQQKDQLPPNEEAGKKHQPVGKDEADTLESRGRITETGAGRGPEHKGH